jgi:hydroxymethylglutaryl-CoA reductase (NADPH)
MSRQSIPREVENDHSVHAARIRREFLTENSGAVLDQVAAFSFDPETTRGNIENFIGAAQVPIGIAGPLLIKGEHATGEFYVPLATTEGALVASYNRGMRMIHESGGATVTISQDHMQRSPAFLFASAREARDFGLWVHGSISKIREVAESTTRVGHWKGSRNLLSDQICIYVLITQRVMPLVKTWSAKQHLPPVCGSKKTT